MRLVYSTILVLCSATASHAQMTTPEQVRPILEMTKNNWVAVRRWEGKDLLYFTHLETWRCALTEIRYALNDGPAEVYAFEPCSKGQGSPAPITAEDHLPYRAFPIDSIETVDIKITYADSLISHAQFARADVEIP